MIKCVLALFFITLGQFITLTVFLDTNKAVKGDFLDISDNMWSTFLALSAGFLFALTTQMQNLGLQHADARTGALISILSTTIFYWFCALFFLESTYWFTWGTVWCALVGLFRPALSANLAIVSIRYIGPTLTSGMAATNPIFGAIFAMLVLGEILTVPLALGIILVVTGIAIANIRGTKVKSGWPIWVIVFPLGAAFFRAAGHPLTIIGYETAPSPFFAGLISYSVSLIVAMAAYKLEGRKVSHLNASYGWFIFSGVINGFSLYLLNYALKIGQLLTVAPIVACSPVFTMLLGLLVFKKEVISWQTVFSIVLVVTGVIMVIVF